MISHYLDHQGTMHRGPGACPEARTMGAGLSAREALEHIRKGRPTCPSPCGSVA